MIHISKLKYILLVFLRQYLFEYVVQSVFELLVLLPPHP